VFTLRTDSCSITGAGVELLRNLVQTRMVKISICANFQIKTTALTANAANPAWATATPGLHDPSALPLARWSGHCVGRRLGFF